MVSSRKNRIEGNRMQSQLFSVNFPTAHKIALDFATATKNQAAIKSLKQVNIAAPKPEHCTVVARFYMRAIEGK